MSDSHELITPDNFGPQALAFVAKVERQLSKASVQDAINVYGIADGLGNCARKLKATTEIINSLQYAKLLVIIQIMSQVPRKAGGRPRNGSKKPANPLGIFSRQTLCFWRKIAEYKAWLQAYCQSVKKANAGKPKFDPGVEEISAVGFVRFAEAKAMKKKFREAARNGTKPFDGNYDVIVVDPPWPGEELPYSTMSLEAIEAIKPPMAQDCHLWLWTTHGYLDSALQILKTWGMKYLCVFDWVKYRGRPALKGLWFNNEFALYARRGSPVFKVGSDFRTAFPAPVGKHSEKPEEFYEMVRRATTGRRLDMFNRRQIAGFDGWGYEAVSRQFPTGTTPPTDGDDDGGDGDDDDDDDGATVVSVRPRRPPQSRRAVV